MGALKTYVFVTRYDIYWPVQSTTHNWMRMNREPNVWYSKSLQLIELEFPFPEHTNRNIWTKYIPHSEVVLYHCIHSAADIELERNLSFKVGVSLQIFGKYKRPRDISSHARGTARSVWKRTPRHAQ